MIRLLAFYVMAAFLGCTARIMPATPNNFSETQAQMLLRNGEVLSGRLIVSMNQVLTPSIRFKPDGATDFQKYSVEDVEGYRSANGAYMLKKLRGPGIVGTWDWFVKRLTPPDSRIHLFEYYDIEQQTSTVNRVPVAVNPREIRRYFLSLPGDTTRIIYAAGSNKFTPNFDEKMSALLSDCPTLARKIADKKDGYFYSDLSASRSRLDVLNTIIDEYNACR